jgi:parallel beta-helix repeat protein
MKRPHIINNGSIFRLALAVIIAVTFLAGVSFWNNDVSANHPVLVEGEQDFDGDGLIGTDEDTDSATDQVFGTINAALGSANAGANQNGRVVIVTSGRFLAMANITAANGNVTLEGAPGVEANIEAVRAGDANNAARQTVPGVVVNVTRTTPTIVTIRNIVSRNWTDGIQVAGTSRVIIDNCRIENNVNTGIHVLGSAKVTINNCAITGNGIRSGAAPVNNSPNPGIGILFEGTSSGTVANSLVSGSVAGGIVNMTSNRSAVGILSVNVFDNGPNDFVGIRPPKDSSPGVRGN